MGQGLDPTIWKRELFTLTTTHPKLVNCFGSTQTTPYLIVMEYCPGGSLFDLLYNTKQLVSMPQVAKILSDVASGMKFLYDQSPPILHRDLKSGNVLLSKPLKSPSSMPMAKVADFGLARAASSSDKMTVGAGTFRWMAPETLQSEGQYNGKVDVFSFAMLAYELVARKLPFEDDFPSSSDPRIAMAICTGARPSLADVILSAEMIELVQS